MVDNLREEYTIDTPENVSFSYHVAGVGSRFIGALVDTILLVLLLSLLHIILFVILGTIASSGELTFVDIQHGDSWLLGIVLAIYAFINFGLFWGYYILFEWFWHGQSPGKRVARTRVMRIDGSPVGVTDVVVRNLVRIIDFLPFGYGIGFLTMVGNRRARRLGDFAAGTLVIRDQGEVSLDDLVAGLPSNTKSGDINWGDGDEVNASIPGAGRLSAADIDLIREGLARADQQRVQDDFIHRLAVAIATKLALPAPSLDSPADRQFLEEVVRTYRRSITRSDPRSQDGQPGKSDESYP